MNRKGLIILLVVFAPWMSCHAQTLHGEIKDENGTPMSGASVYIAELRQGTTTNQEGMYEISLPAGSYTVSYQFLGYVPVTKKITVGYSGILSDIILREQLFEIPAVKVLATGKDPAYFMMRKMIGIAPFHLNQVSMYEAEVYIRGGGRIDKIPKMIRRRMKTDTDEEQLVEGKYYFTESVNNIKFIAPDKYVHRVISSRTNAKISGGQASPMDYIEASFYQPVLADLAISPLAPNAFSHYTFTFLGSSSQGDYVIDKIRVTPRRKSQQLFEGVIYIVEDVWAIQSLDLTNENMAGKIRVKQLYTPVADGIWMPVSHQFEVDLSVIGIKAFASYSCAVKYLQVEPDRSIALTAGFGIISERTVVSDTLTPIQKEIEELLSRDKLSAREMSRLARLNEKNIEKNQEKTPLEVEDKTTYIIDNKALERDSAYWETVRPIPLTEAELAGIKPVSKTSDKLVMHDTSAVAGAAVNVSNNPGKNPAAVFIKDIATGSRWQLSRETSLAFDGLFHLKSFSFNTVDGFIMGTGMNLSTMLGKTGRLMLVPSVKYAFSRKTLMWSVNTNMLYDPLRSGNIFLRAGSYSDEFAASGVNPLVNTVSSLLFRENWMKLYNSTYITAGHRCDLANGLSLSLSATYKRFEPLENTSSFSIFRPDHYYSLNIPVNTFITGITDGYGPLYSFSHSQVSFLTEVVYTPRQRYRISNGSKIDAGSDYPTFTLLWKHGYNYNDTLSSHFDMIMAEISRTNRFGALNEFRWMIRGGGFVHSHNVLLQDMYFFNTQLSPVLLNNYEDAFYLKPYYSISSPSYFAEGHIRYTSPTLLLKRLPLLSRTLIRENIGLSALWTPHYGFYYEAGYTLSEIFFLAELGLYTGFRELSFEVLALRLTIRIE
jgi:hypothetical protein